MQTRTSQGQNFQDSILANLRGRRSPATLYLNNRMALHGRILDFDAYVLLLEPADGAPVQMIYKSAVVSVAGPPRRRARRGGGPGGRQREANRGDAPHGARRPGAAQEAATDGRPWRPNGQPRPPGERNDRPRPPRNGEPPPAS